MDLTHEDYWVAGILEGEGSFPRPGLRSPGRAIISLQMSDRDVVERVALRWGSKIRTPRKPKAHYKQIYTISLCGEPAVTEMKRLYPVMGERRQGQIRDVLTAYTRTREGRLTPAIRTEIVKRKQGGESARTLASIYGITREHVYRLVREAAQSPSMEVVV